MQFPEFGTQVPALKTLWLTFLGMTGLGKGVTLGECEDVTVAGHLYTQLCSDGCLVAFEGAWWKC